MNNAPSTKTFAARTVVRMVSGWVPNHIRHRWVLEWNAELEHESRLVGAFRLLWISLGSVWDAMVLRRIARQGEPGTSMVAGVRNRLRMNTIMQTFNAWGNEIFRTLRNLARHPLHGAIVIVTLALGIGGATAIFSLLDHTALKPLPYPEVERLVRLKNQVPGFNPGAEWELSSAQYFFYLENLSSIEELGLFSRGGANVQTTEGPVRAESAWVTASVFRMLGAHPQLGRLFDDADDEPGGPIISVISYGFWVRQFGQDPNIIGRTVSVDGRTREIVGVLSPEFSLPPDPGAFGKQTPDIWIPRALNPEGPFVNSHGYPAIAKLKNGVSSQEAEQEFELLALRLPEAFPTVYPQAFFDRYGFRTTAYQLTGYTLGDIARSLWLLGGAVFFVLCIAAANVTNLFLVRLEARRRELAVRSALGAGSSGIRRTVFAESLVLASIGGVLGWGIGFAGVTAVFALARDMIPMADSFSFTSGTTLLFTGFLSLWAGLGVGAISLFQQRRRIEVGGLYDGNRSATAGRETHRLRNGLVTVQVGLALTLIVGAGLLAASVQKFKAVDPGISPEGVLAVDLNVTWSSYPTNEDKWNLYREMLARIRALPGVTNAGMVTSLPLTGGYGCTIQAFDDAAVYNRVREAEMTMCAGQQKVTPGYFEALGIPLIQGRTFSDLNAGSSDRGKVIVSQAFAERFWPGEDPLGKNTGPNGYSEGPFFEVIGVVGDIYNNSLDEDPAVAIYYPVVSHLPWGGWTTNDLGVVVQTNLSEPTAVFSSIANVVSELDSEIPLANARSMEIVVADSMARLTFVSVLLEIAAAVAMALAAVGLYGVLSYTVFRRGKEIGVRMAVGATPEAVVRMIVGKALSLVAAGAALGLFISWNTTKVLQGLLFDIDPLHAPTFLLAVAILSVVAFTASWLPARRAAKIDPAETLRAD